MDRVRKVAILVDGGFFLKRLKRWPKIDRENPQEVAKAIRGLCKRHVQKLIGEKASERDSRWLDHVYRLFYYDAEPFSGVPHHPFKNRQINYGVTPEAQFRRNLFNEVRKLRKFALRLGSVKQDGYWSPYDHHMKGLLKIWSHREYLLSVLEDPSRHDSMRSEAAINALRVWGALSEDDLQLPLRQKGVDMRIGLDIATMTLKRQVDTIILVTGDSDFIPAAKLARREGVEFILDPLWQSVEDGLLEHVDGITSGFLEPAMADNRP
ncbi:NYN domain-containing protein [Allorhizobium terrae]|uniref:NYN domain-containing protein n=1 Tax=Allorhizobium terrae TaxID=1848972 RepID=A0A4S3ZXW7_9HYPH|nr:NYN domain-containing protein [Allorhizobium terrae]THF50728.1 NYN domain-containing protein [Allorhizobium terrae]